MSVTAVYLAQDRWHDHMVWDGGWWILMALGMVVFWGLVAAGAVLLVRELMGRKGQGGRGESDAMALLDRRLASGEISPEEYRERRAVLREQPGDSPGAQSGSS